MSLQLLFTVVDHIRKSCTLYLTENSVPNMKVENKNSTGIH